MYIYYTAIYPNNPVLQINHQFTIFCWTVMSLYYTAFIKYVWLTDGWMWYNSQQWHNQSAVHCIQKTFC